MKITYFQRMSLLGHGACLAIGAISAGCIDTPEPGDRADLISSEITLDTTASYTIIGVQSNKCVGVIDGSTASNAGLEIRTCSGVASQRFRPESMTGGFFRLRNELSRLCMDVTGASQADGTAVIQFACSNATNQQWSFTDVASGSDRLTARHSTKVLDVTMKGTVDGTLLEQWTSNDGTNQQFVVTKAVGAFAP